MAKASWGGSGKDARFPAGCLLPTKVSTGSNQLSHKSVCKLVPIGLGFQTIMCPGIGQERREKNNERIEVQLLWKMHRVEGSQ